MALALVCGWSAEGLTQQAAGQETKAAAAVNINTATVAELEKLRGVGAAMALRIVEYRDKNGGFKKIEDLMLVRGIGEKSFLTLKPLITVTPLKAAER
jgi:competence protein ComEA